MNKYSTGAKPQPVTSVSKKSVTNKRCGAQHSRHFYRSWYPNPDNWNKIMTRLFAANEKTSKNNLDILFWSGHDWCSLVDKKGRLGTKLGPPSVNKSWWVSLLVPIVHNISYECCHLTYFGFSLARTTFIIILVQLSKVGYHDR